MAAMAKIVVFHILLKTSGPEVIDKLQPTLETAFNFLSIY